MAISGFLFILWRIVELITLIPPIGMLSYFIHGYIAANELTPNFILVLFIVVVLAGVWVLATLLFYFRARHAGLFVAIIDLGFFAALIAGVVVLNGINAQSCSNFNPSSYIGVSLGPFAYDLGNACGLLKASYAFAIMNIIFFFITFLTFHGRFSLFWSPAITKGKIKAPGRRLLRHVVAIDTRVEAAAADKAADRETADMEGAEWAEMGVGTTGITHHGETNRGGITADRDQTSDSQAHGRFVGLGW